MNRISSFNSNSAILYVVATPVGNMDELSPRAIKTLNEVDYIASEDTRTTGMLLTHFNIKKRMISYHQHNESLSSEKIIALLNQGNKIALTSDAGYPGISDPGEILIKKVIEAGFPVSIINGASAFLPALIASGLPCAHFYFYGFLKSKATDRRKELEDLKNYPMTLIIYESPHRIKDTLTDIYEIFGDRRISLAREITKIHEEYIRGRVSELLTLEKDTLRGEMVLIIEGCLQKEAPSLDDIKKILKKRLKEDNISKKELAKEIADAYNLRKNDVYQMILEM